MTNRPRARSRRGKSSAHFSLARATSLCFLPPMIRAALFDFDGIVIDSHDAHERSWMMLAEELGTTFTRAQFKATFGQRNQSILPWLGWAEAADAVRIQSLGDRKEHLYREILRAEGIDPLPGAIELLGSLNRAGIPCVIGTSTPRANVDCVLELTGLGGHFQTIVAAEDVSRGKPDPEVFVTGARRCGVEPACAVVFEDAHAGLRAAKAGGMKAVAVTTTHPAPSLATEAPDLIVDSLAEIDIARLRSLWA